jgi:hypothetical protein
LNNALNSLCASAAPRTLLPSLDLVEIILLGRLAVLQHLSARLLHERLGLALLLALRDGGHLVAFGEQRVLDLHVSKAGDGIKNQMSPRGT